MGVWLRFPLFYWFLLQTQNAKLQPLKNSLIKREKDNLPSILYLQFYTPNSISLIAALCLFGFILTVGYSLMSESY